ncbi:hypothetical protein D3C76_1242350 [compost metagenome]
MRLGLEDGKLEAFQRFASVALDDGIGDCSGDHHRSHRFAVGNLLAVLDQADQVAACPNVVLAWLDWYEHQVGGLDRGCSQFADLRHAIDKHVVIASGDARQVAR